MMAHVSSSTRKLPGHRSSCSGSEIVAERAYPRPVRRRAFALSILLGLAGCATGQAPIQPAYTQDDLRAQCERHHGWWRPGGRREGFCEFDSQM